MQYDVRQQLKRRMKGIDMNYQIKDFTGKAYIKLAQAQEIYQNQELNIAKTQNMFPAIASTLSSTKQNSGIVDER